MPQFKDFLEELDHGRVHQQLTEHLEKVIDGVQTHGTSGEVTLTIKLTKEGDRAMAAASAKVKIPTEPLASTLFFFDLRGDHPELTRDDPRQLTLKEIPKQPKAPKDVDSGKN